MLEYGKFCVTKRSVEQLAAEDPSRGPQLTECKTVERLIALFICKQHQHGNQRDYFVLAK